MVDPVSVVATHLSEIIRSHADEFLDRQNLQALIDRMKEDHPVVVNELLPDTLGVGDILRVCRESSCGTDQYQGPGSDFRDDRGFMSG